MTASPKPPQLAALEHCPKYQAPAAAVRGEPASGASFAILESCIERIDRKDQKNLPIPTDFAGNHNPHERNLK